MRISDFEQKLLQIWNAFTAMLFRKNINPVSILNFCCVFLEQKISSPGSHLSPTTLQELSGVSPTHFHLRHLFQEDPPAGTEERRSVNSGSMLGEVYIIPKLFKTENGGQFCIESNPVLAFNENVDVEKIDDSSSTQDEKADIYVHHSLPLSSTDEKEIQMGT
ncbi:hypothetical protein QE152_g23058 [Popillia japonica]|uniref:Uncharacterized protein n=1 Tax=Popillia japonica TaxID=7064 RepID=A0AAW1KIS4_POPJA